MFSRFVATLIVFGFKEGECSSVKLGDLRGKSFKMV